MEGSKVCTYHHSLDALMDRTSLFVPMVRSQVNPKPGAFVEEERWLVRFDTYQVDLSSALTFVKGPRRAW